VRRAFARIYGEGAAAPIGTVGSTVGLAPSPRPAPVGAAAAAALTTALAPALFDAYGGNDPPPPPPPPAPPPPAGAYALPPPASSAAALDAAVIHAFMITQDYFTFTCELLQTLLLGGVIPHVVGFGGPGWDSGDGRGLTGGGVAFRWGLGKPILALRAPVEALVARGGGASLVLVADAHDTLLAVPGSALAAAFRRAQARRPGTRVLFAAERSCFPISAEDCARFPDPPAGLPYRMLNSGAWMGEAADVLDVLDAVELMYPGGIDAPNVNDQAALQYLFLDTFARALLGLALDYENDVFMCMHMAAREAQPHATTPGRVCNALSGSCPALLHFNGGSKPLQPPIDAALASTAALAAAGADAAAMRRALAGYALPEVGEEFRDFCCDARWTDAGAFNKIPVPSMRCTRRDDGWAD
jgi:hypothetical protein